MSSVRFYIQKMCMQRQEMYLLSIKFQGTTKSFLKSIVSCYSLEVQQRKLSNPKLAVYCWSR
nr:MAG TPA: hypothetical protein [Caudoviricetes sp.]